jgi:hypothetical protein
MSDGAVIEKSDLILDELTRLGLELARDLQRRALEAEGLDQAARLAQAFHQISRSVRQSLALTAKLQRDRARARRDEETFTERRAAERREARKAHARSEMRRLIWTEAERAEAEKLRLCADLDLHLDAEAAAEAFLEGPVRQLIEKLRKQLGLQPPQPDDLSRRSSA